MPDTPHLAMAAGISDVTIEYATASLRWNSGILEQRWTLETCRQGERISVREEWRPIPEGAWR